MRRSPPAPAAIALFLAVTVAASPTLSAAAGFAALTSHTFEGIYTGTRLTAMGGGDIAADDGPGALLVNPSPLMRGDAVAVAHDHVDYPLGSYTGDEGTDLDYMTTSLGVEWKGWRFSACVSDESLDNAVLRTAYLPEGTGTFDRRSRMALLGMARRLAGDPRAADGGQWTVGVNYRSYSDRTSDNRTDPMITFDDGTATGTWDLGTTAAFRFTGPAHDASLAASVAWQNVTDATRVVAERKMKLPRVVRMGVTAGLTFRKGPRERARVIAAASRSEYADAVSDKGTNQVGLEVTALRLLSLRVGSNERFFGGARTWGLGLVLDHPRDLPLELNVDYGQVGLDDNLYSDADLAMWSGRVRVDY